MLNMTVYARLSAQSNCMLKTAECWADDKRSEQPRCDQHFQQAIGKADNLELLDIEVRNDQDPDVIWEFRHHSKKKSCAAESLAIVTMVSALLSMRLYFRSCWRDFTGLDLKEPLLSQKETSTRQAWTRQTHLYGNLTRHLRIIRTHHLEHVSTAWLDGRC